MHALHRPHLPHAAIAPMLIAVLAIILTLAMTTGLSDVRTSSGTAGPSNATLAGSSRAADATGDPAMFATSPFRSSVIAPVTLPWASAGRPPGPDR